MSTPEWFDDYPVIGSRSPQDAAAKLREVGDERTARVLDAIRETDSAQAQTFGDGRWPWPFSDRPWQHTAHAFGYLAPRTAAGIVPIVHAGSVQADESLRNSRVKITLDALRVAGYPGFGDHRILFDFYAQNHLPGNVEHLHYNLTFRVREGESAAIIGYPIFVGLGVGVEGLSFKCFTVNVKNDADEAFLSYLESEVLSGGLALAATVQPAITMVSGFALGLTKMIAARNRNVPVQDFYIGLDFSRIVTRARLAEGSYIAVQIPERITKVWEWSDWVYKASSGQVVNARAAGELIPYNYVVLSVSRYVGD
jgi:hypothetical protein